MGKFRGLWEYAVLIVVWVGLMLFFGWQSENFLSARTFTSLAGKIPTLAVVAAGMTLVLIIAGIDLSVGSILGLSGAVFGLALSSGNRGVWTAGALALATGVLVGLINGLLSVKARLPSFIVTLGMLELARGGAYLATDSQTKYLGLVVEPLAKPIAGLGLPPSFFIAMFIVIVAEIVLRKTVFGRHLIAIGTNENAVRLAGINPHPAKIAVFIISGFLSALGALFYTARLGSSDPNAGTSLELAAIAAVVIGGTSLMGGRGSVINSLLGVLIIATLEAGLASLSVSEPIKRIVTGIVIIIAVLLDLWRKRAHTRES